MDLNASTAALQQAQLALGALGSVTVSGSMLNSMLVGASNIGAVSVGGDMSNSVLVAGVKLGGDVVFNGNESFIQQAAVASVTVKGRFSLSSIAAGVSPGADSTFGNSDDHAANNFGALTAPARVGALSFGPGTTTALSAVGVATLADHSFAIESATMTSLKIGALAQVTDFSSPSIIDQAGDGDGAADAVIRLVV